MKGIIMSQPVSPALAYIQHAWDHAPCKSYQRFNGAMSRSLKTAIASGMTFGKDDFSFMRKELALSRWSGENLEWAYSLACGSDRGSENPSAVQALETYLKREPFLWAEETKTPARLNWGSTFTWKGFKVTVTSFNDAKKSIVACTYKNNPGSDTTQVGDTDYFEGERIIEAIKRMEDGAVAIRLSAPVESGYERRKPAKIFTISAEEMKSVRLDYDRHRRLHEKAIRAAATFDELESARSASQAEGASAYRHFDLEILTAAIYSRREEISRRMSADERERVDQQRRENHEANLRRWVAGEDIHDFLHSDIRIRVKGDYVEVSNGNKVSIDAARLTLAFVARHRKKGWQENGEVHDVDAFKLRSVSSDGVKIGCTLIPWSEVDRCNAMLKGNESSPNCRNRCRNEVTDA